MRQGSRYATYICWLNNYIDQSPSWEAKVCLGNQEIGYILWDTKVYYRFHKIPLLVPLWRQRNSIYTLKPYFLSSILVLSSHLHLGLLSCLFPSGWLSDQNFVCISYLPMCATGPAHIIFLNFIVLIIFGEESKVWSCSFCSFLYHPIASSPLGPNFLVSSLFSNTLNLISSLNMTDQVSHPYKTTNVVKVLYILLMLFSDTWTLPHFQRIH